MEANQFNLFTQKLHNGISKLIKKFNGKILNRNDNTYVVAFESVTNIILCALKVQSNFKYITPKFDTSIRALKMGIAHNSNQFNAQRLATIICEIVKNQLVITSETKADYEKENRNIFINNEHIRTLKTTEVEFLKHLMDYIETTWNNTDFNVVSLSRAIELSASQIYRRLKSLTGKSPSTFIRDFRLNRAMQMMHHKKGNISNIAQWSGFNSATYFSKCFKEKFHILPSKYTQQH
ncbi:hypothetical protein A9Q87_10320 [Flavobacteriales bacterium 34_180_T64]|nr:hypothetical protein A9Q87_10320 [Flavobacteriales bacterium 34_180_T64]